MLTAHETLDVIFTRLEEDTFRVEEERTKALRAEIAEATLRYYNAVLQEDEDPDPAIRLARGLVFVYSGRLNDLLTKYDRAHKDFEQADRLLGTLAREYPDNTEYQREWAYGQYRHAGIDRKQLNREEAKAKLHHVVKILTPLVTPGVENAKERRLLGLTHSRLAMLCWEKSHQEALRHAKATIACWTHLVENDPENNEYRMRLVSALKELQAINFLDGHPERDDVLPQAEAAMRPFLESPPRHLNDLLGLYHLAELYRLRGTVFLVANKQRLALEYLDKGVRTLERVLQKEPRHTSSLLAMYALHYSRAAALQGLDRREEALKAWDHAVEFASRIPEDRTHADYARIERAGRHFDYGDRARALSEASALAGNARVSPDSHFRLAELLGIAYSRLGDEVQRPVAERQKQREEVAAAALLCLRHCRAAGYFKDAKNRESLKSWPQFHSLRSLPEIQKLLAEWK